MYSKNDIVYASEPGDEITVAAAKPLPYGMLLLTFSFGKQRLFDVTSLQGEAFAPLKDAEVQIRRSIKYRCDPVCGNMDAALAAIWSIRQIYRRQAGKSVKIESVLGLFYSLAGIFDPIFTAHFCGLRAGPPAQHRG